MNNKIKTESAFTLAEVLITLVIIGIVAALTISAVINTYVERSTISKVKKGLSTIAQAKKLAEAQNGSIIGWNFGEGATAQTAADFWKYIKPHISVAKDCGSGTDCYQSDGIKKINGYSYSNNFNALSKYYKFILSDGSVMWFRTGGAGDQGKCSTSYESGVENICAVFFYDINGIKQPNTLGRDIFGYIVTLNGVYPNNYDSCNTNSTGIGCTAYIMTKGNMNYLH